ncbi:hypothetical protein [Streptomyces sp. NPDC047071]|uniref:TolB family protein n=1 Tax=Streptomyces sp. NPDC047071 TaxID=3154808 RepID=UPI003454B2D1
MRGNTGRSATRRLRTALSAAVVVCAITAALPAAASAEPAAAGATGDRGAGVQRISVAPDGTRADGDSAGASITPDGRTIVYSSSATNLTPDAPPGDATVFVRDQRTGQTKRMGNLAPLQAPVISGDGRFVAYQDAQAQDVFVGALTGATAAVPIEGPSRAATLVQLSDDGSKVVYLSGSDTYVHDVSSGTARLVPDARGLAIGPTGRYLLYAPHDTGGPSLVLRDPRTGTDETVSNQPASAGTDAVSADGRDVVFRSGADDLVPGDTNGKADLFVRTFH